MIITEVRIEKKGPKIHDIIVPHSRTVEVSAQRPGRRDALVSL